MAFLMSLERMIRKYGQILALVMVKFSRLRHILVSENMSIQKVIGKVMGI